MFQFLKITAVLCILLNLLGCAHLYGEKGFINDRANDYQTGQETAALAIPANLASTELNNDYIVPPIEIVPQKKPDNLLPPGSMADKAAHGEKIVITEHKQASQDRVEQVVAKPYQGKMAGLIINQEPQAAWSTVGEALKKAEYKIVVTNPAVATYFILDTPATHGKVRKDTAIYQVHLRAFAPDNTEVYLTDNDGKAIDPEINHRICENLNNALQGKTKSSLSKFFAEII